MTDDDLSHERGGYDYIALARDDLENTSDALNAAGWELGFACERHTGEPTTARVFNNSKAICRDIIKAWLAKTAFAARLTQAAPPADLLRKLPLLITNLKAAEAGHEYRSMRLSVDYLRLIIEMLEAARDALAAQDAPAPTDDPPERITDWYKRLGTPPAVPAPRGMTLPTHDEIRAKYSNIPQPPTALERLIFDTAVDDPEQGEALRAFLEGRA